MKNSFQVAAQKRLAADIVKEKKEKIEAPAHIEDKSPILRMPSKLSAKYTIERKIFKVQLIEGGEGTVISKQGILDGLAYITEKVKEEVKD